MEVDIVFADADQTLRDVYHVFFSRKGFRIETVASKWECVEQVVSGRPFILIADMELFGEDGERTVLSDAEAFREIPTVIVTGDDLPQRLSEQTGVPLSNCFRKPYSFVKLLNCICDRVASAAVSPRHSIESLTQLSGIVAGQEVEKTPEVSIC